MEKSKHSSNKKSRTFNSIANITTGFGNKLLTMILTFVSRAIFVRVLAAEYLGITGLFSDILSMLALADLGITTAIIYSFYKPLAENDYKKLAALTTYYRRIYNFIAFVIALIGLLLVPFLKYLVRVDHQIPHLTIYYLIALGNSVISYLFVYKSCIIGADQKSYITTKYSMWISCAKLLVQTIVLYLTKSYLLYVSVNILATLANNIMISMKADRLYPYIKERVALDKNERKSIFANLKAVILYKIAGVSIAGTDNTLISVLVGTAYVGLYSNYYTITSSLWGIANIIFGSITASIGNLLVKENAEKRYEVFKVMQMISFWISSVMFVCCFFLIDDFIILWVGQNYLFNEVIVLAILLNSYFTISLQPMLVFRDSSGLYVKTKYILLLTAVLNIVLSIGLGIIFGVAGILYATTISKVCTYFWYEPIVLFKDYFDCSCREYFKQHLINIVVMLLSLGVISLVIPRFNSVTVLNWFIKGIVSFSIVMFIYFIRYYNTKEFKNLLLRTKNIIGHVMKKRRQYE